jgi:hypothetical protein
MLCYIKPCSSTTSLCRMIKGDASRSAGTLLFRAVSGDLKGLQDEKQFDSFTDVIDTDDSIRDMFSIGIIKQRRSRGGVATC